MNPKESTHHWLNKYNKRGQDGAYLAELLLEKGYVVHGIKRRSSMFNTLRVDHLYQDPHLIRILGVTQKTKFYQA